MESQSAPGTLRPSSRAKRQAILAAAEDAFLTTGFVGVTMDDIAESSGVSKQTVYAHFGTKDQLFVDLVTGMTRDAGDEVAAKVPSAATRTEAAAALEHVLTHQLALVLTPRLLRLRRLVIAEVPRFPDLARAVHEQGPRRAMATLESMLSDYAARGWVRVPNLSLAAEQLNWLVMGGPTTTAMFLGDDVAPEEQQQRAAVREAVRVFLAAYGTATGETESAGQASTASAVEAREE